MHQSVLARTMLYSDAQHAPRYACVMGEMLQTKPDTKIAEDLKGIYHQCCS